MKPRGATELQMEMLEKYVSKDILDQVQICTSIPGKVPLDPNKLNILWQKNAYNQPNLQEFFCHKIFILFLSMGTLPGIEVHI